MDGDEVPAELHEMLLRGLDLFDAGMHFEAHEDLEELWMGEVGATRHLLQALIQLTVALHHRERGNLSGADALLERAQGHLEQVPAPACFLDPRRLETAIAALRAELAMQRRQAEATFDAALVPRFDDARAQIRAGRRARGLPEI